MRVPVEGRHRRVQWHSQCREPLRSSTEISRVGIEATRMNAPTEYDPLEIVSTENLERELTLVRGAAAGSLAGVFGPRSITWQVDREAAIFLGAGRALLLQLAHPWIAAAIEQHSDTFANPIGRFHRTFSTVFTMVFGTLVQSLDAARRLHRRHASIQGTLQSAAGPFPAGSSYYANEVSALRWVHASLVDTALVTYALVLPALTEQQRERYYAESRLFAALFGIPSEHLARDWAAFAAYTEAMARSSRIQGPDGGAASTAVTRRVRTALWQGRRGRGAAVSRAGATDLSLLARSASLCRTLSGGRTTPCRQDATGLRRTHVQPILDGAVRSRSPADVTGALTPNDVIQILPETLRHRDQQPQSS